ncbi:MAG: outer membrane protein assembly factor BamB [Kiritimatiellia bacterium]|jgi:outer membrane protein assembly factor BamB
MKKYSVLLITLVLGTSTAGDWPMFRGPDGNGHAAARDVPLTWGPNKQVRWKVETPPGWSSPILVAGRLYLTGAREFGADDTARVDFVVLCLAADSGAKHWEKTVFTHEGPLPRMHKKNSRATPTPVIENDRLYVHFGPQGTACLDLQGKVVWKNNSLDYPPVHGQGASPILVGDLLFFSCDGQKDPFVVGMKKASGEIAWKTQRTTNPKKPFSFATATSIVVNGQPQIISPGSGAVFAYDPASGKELWKVGYGDGYSVIPKPVFAHGLLFISSSYDKPVLLAVKPGGEGDLTESNIAWQANRGVPHTPSMLVIGDELYFISDGGIMSCVDARTGTLHWQERTCGTISASPIVAEGRIYVQDEKGVCVVIKAGKTFEKLAENDLGERSLASFAVDDGALYIRTDKHLYRIGK